MTVDQLEQNIRQWGIDRNITAEGGATVQAQVSKAIEEIAEAVKTLGQKEVNQEQLKDDLGDITVCVIQAARLAGTDLTECLTKSWEDIRYRKGTMVNGVFVKEE